jgi:hypothetical protein|tara:strand:+ start:405 stop:599 length:195 start_codon:yes stop_codon:yes gene_type:complete
MMAKEYIKEIPNWEKQYLEMAKGELSKQQIELLEGRDIKSHEGMIYGEMYNNWKRRKTNDKETV